MRIVEHLAPGRSFPGFDGQLRRLRLADASLAQLRVGGTFNATDPESFAAAVASAFSLRVAHDTDAIVLRPP